MLFPSHAYTLPPALKPTVCSANLALTRANRM